MPRFCSALASRLAPGLLLALALGSSTPAQTLLPAPREAHFGAPVDLPAKVVVPAPGNAPEDEFAAQDLEDALGQLPPADAHGPALSRAAAAHRYGARPKHCSRATISASIRPWNRRDMFW